MTLHDNTSHYKHLSRGVKLPSSTAILGTAAALRPINPLAVVDLLPLIRYIHLYFCSTDPSKVGQAYILPL